MMFYGVNPYLILNIFHYFLFHKVLYTSVIYLILILNNPNHNNKLYQKDLHATIN